MALQLIKTGFRIATGTTLVGAAVWATVGDIFSSRAEWAVLSGELTQVAAPVEGNWTSALANGQLLPANTKLGTLENTRFDTSQLIALESRREQLHVGLEALTGKQEGLQSLRTRMRGEASRYERRRRQQLELELSQARARVDAADARANQANAALERAKQLVGENLVSQEELQRAQRDSEILNAAAKEARSDIEGRELALTAASQGFQLSSGSVAEKPYLEQRADEIETRVPEVSAQRRALEGELSAVERQLGALHENVKARTSADLATSERSRVWLLRAQSGQFVNRGQTLVQLLKCDSLFVTAVVSERMFSKLRIGMPAVITLVDSGSSHDATVSAMLGADYPYEASLAPGIAGIVKRAADDGIQKYVVTVRSKQPIAAQNEQCNVGHPVKVKFRF